MSFGQNKGDLIKLQAAFGPYFLKLGDFLPETTGHRVGPYKNDPVRWLSLKSLSCGYEKLSCGSKEENMTTFHGFERHDVWQSGVRSDVIRHKPSVLVAPLCPRRLALWHSLQKHSL